MNTPSSFWAVVPAAGIGSRMAAARPKQYLEIAGKTILEHTIERLLSVELIERVVVALHPEDVHWNKLGCASHPRVSAVTGGAERAQSVALALEYIKGCAAQDVWVLVHDAARPCVRIEDIQRLMAAGEGALLAAPISDTVKRAERAQVIETLDRQQLWSAMTPQMFSLNQLHSALMSAAAKGQPVTDEASAIEFVGGRPRLVEASRDNIKVTRPEDLALAEMILTRQQEE